MSYPHKLVSIKDTDKDRKSVHPCVTVEPYGTLAYIVWFHSQRLLKDCHFNYKSHVVQFSEKIQIEDYKSMF